MQSTAVVKACCKVERTPRVLQLEGLFSIAPTTRVALEWEVSLPLAERDWNLGFVVGPSGSGKTQIATSLWSEYMRRDFTWPDNKSVLDAFPASMTTKDIVQLLSSVGFSSPPAWLRPFRVLSNGEQFRVTLARLLAELPECAVIDEFTSVVDRTVAQIGSAALAKTVRRRKQKLIAVTCHEDVENWLQPDWVYRTDTRQFSWRCLQRRPELTIEIVRVHHSAWRLFGQYHYLDEYCSTAAHCYVGFYHHAPIAFLAVLPMVARHLSGRNSWRASRLVVIPDYQGVGIGNALCDCIAGGYRALGYRFFVTTGHPARVQSLARHPLWRMIRPPSLGSRRGTAHYHGLGRKGKHAAGRITAGFEYVGPARDGAAAVVGIRSTPGARVRAGPGGAKTAADAAASAPSPPDRKTTASHGR